MRMTIKKRRRSDEQRDQERIIEVVIHLFRGKPYAIPGYGADVPINYRFFEIDSPTADQATDLGRVREIAAAMKAELDRVSDEIDRVHVWRAKSDVIADVFRPWLGANYTVRFEKCEGFEDSTTRKNRPDAQILLNETGTKRILVEVERGGTVTNGHDLKDMWKCHLSPLTQHLFLVVPNTIEAETGKLRADQAFVRCSARLGSFFKDRRTAIDVWSVHLFGYGKDRIGRSRARPPKSALRRSGVEG